MGFFYLCAMFKKDKERINSEFKLAITTVETDGKDSAMCENLHRFATQLGYLDAAIVGGKLTSKQAYQQVKDLYKAWKETNKSIEKE